MTDCPHCDYHKKRAQLWREEAYRQAGHPLPERNWVWLTDKEIMECFEEADTGQTGDTFRKDYARTIETKLKELNK